MDTKQWLGAYKLDENKNAIPCTMEEWGEQRREMVKNHTKHVGYDSIDNKKVSTVWLGLDHQWDDNIGIPLLFETMIFEDATYNEIYCERYSTWQEAEKGHQKAIEWVKNGCKEEQENE